MDITDDLPRWVIQYVEPARDRGEAELQLGWLRTQDGFLGGRVLPPKGCLEGWRTQTFFEDEPDAKWLPDGCLRVLILPCLKHLLSNLQQRGG